MFYEDDGSIEIAYSKYLSLSIGALRTLASKYGITFYFGTKKRDLALTVIPDAMENDTFLEDFYNNLKPKEQKILKYIVNYRGKNLHSDVKKVFKFDIVSLRQGGRDVYVWWLELFVDQGKMDEELKLYFLSFLEENNPKDTKEKKPHPTTSVKATLRDISKIKIDKLDSEHNPVSQKLLKYEPEDIVTTVRIVYQLAKDTKIKITQKGTLAVRSEKLIRENVSVDNTYYIWLLNFLMGIKYLFSQKETLPTKAFDTAIAQDDGMLMKTLFEQYIETRVQHEFGFFIFEIQAVSGNLISGFRLSILEIMKKTEYNEWISIDYIVDQIPLNAKTIKQITNEYNACYSFDANYYRQHSKYNRLENLKIVVRYFIKSFIGIAYRFGLFDIAKTPEDSFIEEDLELLDGYYSSPFAAIEYAKLTDLGKFVLNIEKSFSGKNDFSLTLSPYSYEIKVDNPGPLSDVFLLRVAAKTDENRYHTDIKIFMNSIDSAKNYESVKNEFLSKCDTVPPNWQTFFETINRRISSTKVISRTAILIEITNPKEILRIITSNPKLQEKILKTDKFHIVVFKENLNYVKKALREYGVIL
ncbi:MAG: hypothetical protein DRG30_08405 [Epsilonproteobacteria bacterium]|nr:MAG: hypothetical protein DRG30_08405 [Campylobacterota bacterium]